MSRSLGWTVAGVVCVLAVVLPLQAKLSFSEQVIVKGTKIEVVGPGPDLQAIIDGITDASADKPYLIKLGPGVYTIDPDPLTGEGLKMAPFISIMGSGQGRSGATDARTALQGAVSSSAGGAASAIVSGASSAALTDLNVENAGGGTFSFGIYNDNASPHIERVTARASGGTTNFGVNNFNASPTMTQVIATASGGDTSMGVYNFSSTATMIQVTAKASDATKNYGVFNSNLSPAMTQVIATALLGSESYGVFNVSSSPTMTQVTATAAGPTSSYGVYNASITSSPRIEASTLRGDTNGMRFGGATGTRITNTQIIGGIDADPDPTTTQCFRTYDASLALISC